VLTEGDEKLQCLALRTWRDLLAVSSTAIIAKVRAVGRVGGVRAVFGGEIGVDGFTGWGVGSSVMHQAWGKKEKNCLYVR
jgi:hypothetical protein